MAEPAGGALHYSGTVLSDLHLFTNRTTMDDGASALCTAAQMSAMVVLNGDIFDFKWSLHGEVGRSAAAAQDWLGRLASDHAYCRWVVLLGNHDDVPEYRQALERLAGDLPNFAWCDQWLRVGSRAFLHGDVCSGALTPEELCRYRARFGGHPPRRDWQHQLYWLAARSRVPAAIMRMHSKRRAARRVEAYLRYVLGDEFESLTDVYFGHVHIPFRDFQYADRFYHNTGAALVGMRMIPMRFLVAPEELAELDARHGLQVPCRPNGSGQGLF